MQLKNIDLSAEGWARVALLTILGTAVCVVAAFAIDSYSFETGAWRLGDAPWNNLVIPLVVAPPFFFYLLKKLRDLAIAHRDLLVVASTDQLTACLNRRAFTTLVDAYLARFSDNGVAPEGALLVIDVDHFKSINDRFGHASGDQALKLIASTIRQVTRDNDLVGRIGGEEFGVFLPGASPLRTWTVADRIRKAVFTANFQPDGTRHDLSVSVGGTTFDRKASFNELFDRADERLYFAKRNGRNRVEIAQTPMNGGDLVTQLH